MKAVRWEGRTKKKQKIAEREREEHLHLLNKTPQMKPIHNIHNRGKCSRCEELGQSQASLSRVARMVLLKSGIDA